MTDYTTIPDGDIDQDSPVTQPLLSALRDNPLAIAEGATGAPRINPLSLGDLAAGDTLSCGAQSVYSLDTAFVFEFAAMQGGSVRVKGQAKGDSNAVDLSWTVIRIRAGSVTTYGNQTFDNATSYTSFTDVDIPIQYGDLIRATVTAAGGGGDVRNVSIHTDGTQPIWTTSNFGYIHI